MFIYSFYKNFFQIYFQNQEKLKILDKKSEELQELEKTEQNDETIKSEKIHLTELLNVLRKQKSELKQHCREEKQRLERQIESIESRQVTTDQLNDKLKEIDQELHVYDERHLNVKKDLSLINKKYSIIQRKFDDVPNRTELAQYQKRFLELYNQCMSLFLCEQDYFILIKKKFFLFDPQYQQNIMKQKNSTHSTIHYRMNECIWKKNLI